MIREQVCGLMREQSMLYKTSNILKNSFLTIGLAYLLTSTCYAQSPLDLADDSMPKLSLEEENRGQEENQTQNNQESNTASEQNSEIAPVENGEGPLFPENGSDNTLSLQNQQEAPFFPENASDDAFPLSDQQEKPLGLDENALGGETGSPLDVSNTELKNENQEISPKEEQDAVLNAYNNFVEATDREAFENPQQNKGSTFGDKIMDQVKEDLFSQMADIEKQTSLLTLELKREKIKNEIAAMHAERQKAIEEEKEKQLEKERRQKEWEREQERKLLEEKQKLKETEIKFEKLRQERVLKAYKESMLKTNQEWVEYNARLYNQLVREEEEQNNLLTVQKGYFKDLSEGISGLVTAAQQAKEKYNREIANLQTQVAILKSKLEAEKNAFEESKKSGPNPFALVEDDPNASKQKISEEYAIMEISGKGEKLVAKLINKNGGTFMVKPGTILNTGHVIEEITQTYIVTDKGGIKDYLYFSAGGILDKEPTKTINAAPKASVASQENEGAEIEATPVPSLREGMFVE